MCYIKNNYVPKNRRLCAARKNEEIKKLNTEVIQFKLSMHYIYILYHLQN